MKRPYFILTFIATHIFFIFFQIRERSEVIKLSYCKQKSEQQKEILTQKIQELTQQLYALQERATIKKYAQETLQMKKLKLSQIQKLDLTDLSGEVLSSSKDVDG